METIFALATAPGKAGVAVIRVSGPRSWDVLSDIAGDVPRERVMALRVLRDEHGSYLDQALVVAFDAGGSFTGERVVELQLHGGRAVVQSVLAVLEHREDCRFAEPGEFTRRAFQNGKMDLTQVEALADVIDAETEVQRKHAVALLSGAFSERVAKWRTDIVRALAFLEASIDFADEEIPEDLSEQIGQLLSGVAEDVARELSGLKTAERLRDGFEVAIVGAPNAGKSTLLNYLAGREAAITSDIPGTTRDVIEVRMDVHGLPVTFLDTAGLRETQDAVERMGVDRARSRAVGADLRVHLAGSRADLVLKEQPGDIVVAPKSDLSEGSGGISGVTGDGVSVLLQSVFDILSERVASAGLASRSRHKSVLQSAHDSLNRAIVGLSDDDPDLDLVSEDIRSGSRSLEAILGRVDVEHVLDEIFSSFCLGK